MHASSLVGFCIRERWWWIQQREKRCWWYTVIWRWRDSGSWQWHHCSEI